MLPYQSSEAANTHGPYGHFPAHPTHAAVQPGAAYPPHGAAYPGMHHQPAISNQHMQGPWAGHAAGPVMSTGHVEPQYYTQTPSLLPMQPGPGYGQTSMAGPAPPYGFLPLQQQMMFPQPAAPGTAYQYPLQ